MCIQLLEEDDISILERTLSALKMLSDFLFSNFSLNERELTKIRAFHCERRSDKINRMEMCAEGVWKQKLY